MKLFQQFRGTVLRYFLGCFKVVFDSTFFLNLVTQKLALFWKMSESKQIYFFKMISLSPLNNEHSLPLLPYLMF